MGESKSMNSLITGNGNNGTTLNFKGDRLRKSDLSIEVLAWGDLVACKIGGLEKYSGISRIIQIIMAGVSSMSSLDLNSNVELAWEECPYRLCGADITVLDDLQKDFEEILNFHNISHWVEYDGNPYFEASKFVRLFEVHFNRYVDSLGDIFQVEKVFINKLSDLLFYSGIIKKHSI